MEQTSWQWPHGRNIAVVFNVAFEAWSDGKAPGISPMGNPLPAIPGIVDSMAISWAAYGARRGIYRLLEAFARHSVRASVMMSAILAERSPEVVRAVGDGGHEVVSHSYAMDVMPVMMGVEEERLNIERCTDLLAHASRSRVRGWISPRGTPSPNTARLLAEVDYLWYGDVFDDDLPYVQTFGESRIVALPLGTDVNDMRSMKYGDPPRKLLEDFEDYLERVAKGAGGPVIIDATVHAHIFGRPHGAYYYERIMELAARSPEIWVATREQIANHVLNLR
jgi:hypothetical protein